MGFRLSGLEYIGFGTVPIGFRVGSIGFGDTGFLGLGLSGSLGLAASLGFQ